MKLNDEQRIHLQRIIEDPSSTDEARRNAGILLQYADGAQTRDIARAVGLSESRTRFWRKVFERHGMDMFSEDFTPERRAPRESTASGPDPAHLLSDDDAARLRSMLDGDVGEDLQKRVHLILSYSSGKSTNQIAREIGLSESRTRFWRKAFERDGMRIFDLRQRGERGRQETAGSGKDADGGQDVRSGQDSDGGENVRRSGKPDGGKPDGGKPDGGKPDGGKKAAKSAKKKSPGLLPSDSYNTAARKVLRMHFEEMLRHGESGMLGEDPEVVHKMRVATRRMRSAFDVFSQAFIPKKAKPHRKSLKRVGRVLGRVRDLDVLIMHMREYADGLSAEDAPAFETLIQEWEAQRQKDLAALREFLRSDSYTSFCAAFEHFLASEDGNAAPEPAVIEGVPKKIGQIAPVLVIERFTDVLAFDAELDTATLDQLHQLRIQFKKLRYTMEFLVDILGPQAKKVIKQVTDAQDYLGNLQDDQTAMELITAFTHELDIRQSARPLSERLNTAPLLTYLAERQSRKHTLLTSFGGTWAVFTGSDFRRRLLQSLLRA